MGTGGGSDALDAGDGATVTAGPGVATTGLGGVDGDCVTGVATDGEADGRSACADRDGTGTRPAGSWSTVPPVNDVPDPADRVTTADSGLAAASSTTAIVAADRARTMIPVAAMAR